MRGDSVHSLCPAHWQAHQHHLRNPTAAACCGRQFPSGQGLRQSGGSTVAPPAPHTSPRGCAHARCPVQTWMPSTNSAMRWAGFQLGGGGQGPYSPLARPPPPKKRLNRGAPKNPTETDPRATEVTRTQNSAAQTDHRYQRHGTRVPRVLPRAAIVTSCGIEVQSRPQHSNNCIPRRQSNACHPNTHTHRSNATRHNRCMIHWAGLRDPPKAASRWNA